MMKIVLVSNYLNPHMLPVANSFLNNENVDFTFIATTEQSTARKELGFKDYNYLPFVVRAYKDIDSLQKAYEVTTEADVAIIAPIYVEFITRRMQLNKLTFLFTERFYKKGMIRRFIPSSYYHKYKQFLKYKRKNVFFLCMGAYVPCDLESIGFPISKCYDWAYFPSINNLSKTPKIVDNKIRLLWVGRLVTWKHPETALYIAQQLKRRKVAFTLKIVGDGPCRGKIEKIYSDLKLSDCVQIEGKMSPNKTQEEMNNSDVFLFTSDYAEGWGAVLNEAMAAGCVPVASIKAGASPVLIEHGFNGFLYDSVEDMTKIILKLISDKNELLRLSINARDTIIKNWSAEIAAQRFYLIAKSKLLGMEEKKYVEGPMKKSVFLKANNIFGSI